MFHQMLHFLTLKDEVNNDAQIHYNNEEAQVFPTLLSEEQIQKVIFDDKYLKYMAKSNDEGAGSVHVENVAQQLSLIHI